MKSYKILFAACSLLGASMLGACTDGFEEANTNPNNTDKVDAEYLFNTSVYNTLNTFCGSMKKVMLANYSRYYCGATGGELQRFGGQGSSADGYWKSVYNSSLLPVHFISEQLAGDPSQNNRVLIARIWKDYVFSQAAAIWGPIPMSQACSGNVHIAFDSEKDIYYSLLADLKTCADGIDINGDTYLKDPVFPGASGRSDLARWKKLANSLRLRLAMLISNVDRQKASEVLAELMADESVMMTSNADICRAKWGDNVATRNYFYDYLVVNRASNLDKLHAASENILMYMCPYADPRLPKWFTPASPVAIPEDFHWAPYWGQPMGSALPHGIEMESNPHNGKTAADYSLMLDDFIAESYGEVIMNYAEVCLLKCEAVYKGLVHGSKSASEYYADGVRASMEQYGVSGAETDAYLEVPGIKWNTLTDLEATEEGEDYYRDFVGIVSSAITSDEADPVFRQIVMQEYLALFYQSLDGWTLHRRTQVLEFTPALQLSAGAINSGTTDNEFAYTPSRLVYPDSERINNLEALEKGIALIPEGNTMGALLWWAVPIKRNPYLESIQ